MHSVCLIAICFILAQPVLSQQDIKQNETSVNQTTPEFTEAEKAWWREFEKNEGELIKLEDDKRLALEDMKKQVEQNYRDRQDMRLDKMQEEIYRKQQPIHRKFTPLIERAIASYQTVLASGVSQNMRVPLENKRLPTVIHKEIAKYTEEARQNQVEGVVIISVIFQPNGKCTNIRVVKGLPDGLTEKAIEVVTKQVFRPAVEQNHFVAFRGNLEYSFKLF